MAPSSEKELTIHIHTRSAQSAKDVVIPAQGKAIVPTDISIAVPIGTYGRVAPRSGLAVKHHLDVGAGVVDADYRGPLGVVLFNLGQEEYQGIVFQMAGYSPHHSLTYFA